MQKAKRILIITLVLLVVATTVVGATGWHYIQVLYDLFDRPTQEKIDAGEVAEGYIDPKLLEPEELGIVVQPKKSTEDDIYTILLFGVDSASGEKGRSDVICYCAINKTKGTISLISVLRDTLLEIPGKGEDKAAHAFSFGGPQLAIATMNQNFHTDVTDYAVVNFNKMEELIDAMGGVQLDVQQSEVAYINRGVRAVNRDNGRSVHEGSLDSNAYGPNTLLTGRQAVAYARIRKLSGGDYQRSNRQRIVLEALIKKAMTELRSDPTKLLPMVTALLPMVSTSISDKDIIEIVQTLLTQNDIEIVQDRIPADGDFDTGYRGSQWVEFPNLEKCRDRLHTYLYREETERDNLQPTGTPAPMEVLEEEDDPMAGGIEGDLTNDGTTPAE